MRAGSSGICVSDWGGSPLGKLRVVGDESVALSLGFATRESFLRSTVFPSPGQEFAAGGCAARLASSRCFSPPARRRAWGCSQKFSGGSFGPRISRLE